MSEALEVIVIPGGPGTRALARDAGFLALLKELARRPETIATICTGAALAGAAGLSGGYIETTNRRAFDWVSSTATKVIWRRDLSVVGGRERWSAAGISSGISSGIGLALRMVEHRFGKALANEIADRLEYERRDHRSYLSS